MTRKFGLLLTLIALLTINLSAQKAVITFDEKTHDFGNIKEDTRDDKVVVWSGQRTAIEINCPLCQGHFELV